MHSTEQPLMTLTAHSPSTRMPSEDQNTSVTKKMTGIRKFPRHPPKSVWKRNSNRALERTQK